MAGSPRKRAKREAAERAKAELVRGTETELPPQGGASSTLAPVALSVPAPLQGDVLPPIGADPTRTALKRAMRQRAQEHAEKAIAVLVAGLTSPKRADRLKAANDLLRWGFGDPALELGDGDGGLLVLIKKFGDSDA